jgi:hypothetical protein
MKIAPLPTVFEFDDEKIGPIFDELKPALFLIRSPKDANSDF